MSEVKIVKYEQKKEDAERNGNYHIDNVGYRNESFDYEKFGNGTTHHERPTHSFSHDGKKSSAAKTLIVALLLALVALAAVAVALAIVVNQNNDKDERRDTTSHVGKGGKDAQTGTAAVCTSEACVQAASRFIESIDSTADPCDDFFQYACGTWRKKHVIPEDKSITGVFYQVDDDVSVILKYILSNPVQPSDITAVMKAKHLYQSCVNEDQIEKVNLTDAKAFLQSLGGWPVLGGQWGDDALNIESLMVNIRQYSNSPAIFDMYVYDDAKDPDRNVLYLDQSAGWGMPSREYYLKGRDDTTLKAYEKFAVDMAIAFGANPSTAEEDIKNMVDFEIQLANLSMPQDQRRNEEKLYHKYTLQKLKSYANKFNWTKYFTETLGRDGINVHIGPNETIIVRNPEYIKEVFEIIDSTSPRIVQNYVVWRNLKGLVTALPQNIRDIYYVYRKVLVGSSTPLPRWQTCASYTDGQFGEAVGKLFLKEAFDETAREKALTMINNLRTAMKGLLAENEWMDDKTKAVAIEKADFIEPRIGYQEKVLNDVHLNEKYENYTVDAEKYLKNRLAANKVGTIENLRKLRKPVDKTTWDMTPATVNAYYNPQRNQISFPAGILQPPFYQKDYPQYLNYGGIGYVIGHEITHGFDDNGRMYDKYGHLQQWWNNASITNFKSRAECMINQYGNYTVEEANENLNGKLTLGENIADNGGLKESWKAYQGWIKSSNNGQQEPTLPGLKYTQKQLFFLNAAHVWCGLVRPKEALRRIRTDVHSNFKSRVVGPLQNNDDFSDAFQCAKGTKMNPEKKCIIW